MKTIAPPATSALGLVPDPMVPGRDALLDPDHVLELLRGLPDLVAPIESCSLRRVKYRIGESLRVVYDVSVGGGTDVVMSARTFMNSFSAYHQTTPVGRVEGVPGVAHDQRTGSVWWTVPNDRKLRNLGTLLAPPARVRDTSGVQWHRSTLVEYAPERSATVRIDDRDGQPAGYAKAYRDQDPLQLAAQYNRVAALVALVNGMRTPRALGWARPDRIMVLEAMPGRVWKQLPVEAQATAMHRFGAALAHLHGLPTDFGRGPFQRYRPERVSNSADLVATARPDVGDAAHRVRDLLAGGPPAPTSTVCLHGDVHANNVLFHGDQVHLIDFDQGGSGAPSADLGSMLASLVASRLTDPDITAPGLGAAFLGGYHTVRALPADDELRWYTAAALIAERAIRAVNRVHEPLLQVLPALFATAEATLDGSVDVSG